MFKSGESQLSLEYGHLSELEKVVSRIVKFAGESKIWLFDGEMGAGKTTVIKEICKYLQVVSHVSSPTYSIVNEYITKNGHILYHFDFYRIKDEEEAEDIGTGEYFYSGNICFVEWPSKIPALIPAVHFNISINITNNNHRTIHLRKHEQ